ncbi:MAG: adenylate/guanylate cyclase domain-containing protein [Alphaproteobacteria bacterium]|nr:adenylate/guanylate cyclase domain-containing protein [Alphaproteobacteria bacterium]
MAKYDGVVLWLLAEGRRITDGTVMVTELAARLVEAGLPLARLSLNLRTLHPQVLATAYVWKRDAGCAQQIDREHGIQFTDAYLNSPMRAVFEEGRGGRWHLTGPSANLEFPVLQELKDQGFTDYFIMPLSFGNGALCGSTWATDDPDGFSDEDIAAVHALKDALSLVLEVQETRRVAATLLDTYLGRATGGRVLSGQVKRGDHDSIRAVLWLADLRGFTRLSDTLDRDALIKLLDGYFEAIAGPVQRHGGEVLKFMGDGLLAIFPISAGDAEANAVAIPSFAPERRVCDMTAKSASSACAAALAAAHDAEAAFNQLNAQRRERGEVALRFGLALHIGDVFYGNIGAPDRLDFTVIGPAVNLVARIEALNKPLGRTMLASADFARECSTPLIPLGSQALRGVREPQEIFAVPSAAQPAPGRSTLAHRAVGAALRH